MKRRLLSLLLAVVMVLGMLPVSAFAEESYPFSITAGGETVTLEAAGTNDMGYDKVKAQITADSFTITIPDDNDVVYYEILPYYAPEYGYGDDEAGDSLNLDDDGTLTVEELDFKYLYIYIETEDDYCECELYVERVFEGGLPFEATVNGERVGAKKDGSNYIVTVPQNAEELSLTFGAERQCIYYSPDGVFFGYVNDDYSMTASTTHTIPLQDKYGVKNNYADENPDGELDHIRVQKGVNFYIILNRAPYLTKDSAAASETVTLGAAYELNLENVFADADANDTLTYQVSIDGAEAVSAEAEYSYTPVEAGTTTLAFTASDSAASSEAYTVTLTVAAPASSDPFTKIEANGKELTAADIIYKGLVDFTNRSEYVYEDMPYYEVKIPQGTENVYVTYERADFRNDNGLDATTSATISGYSATVTQNADGTFSMSNPGGPALQATGDNSTYTTVEIPVATYVLGENGGKAVSPQTDPGFAPVSFFSFSYTDEVIEGACLTVNEDAPTSATVSAGGLYKLPLSQVFSDRDGHGLQFSYDGTTGYDVSNTKVVDGIFYYCAKKEGTYEIKLTATCDKETVTFTMPVEVMPPHPGQLEQYDYDETDKSSVTVYVTFSNDGYPVMGPDGTPIAHLEVTVPYFDLGLYGLQGLYRMHTKDGQGEYIDSNVVQRPTGLHLYIYLLERYYMGLEESQCCNGTSGVLNYSVATDVFYMDDSLAYSSGSKKAMATSGGKYDLFMTEFWGHDCNLMYFRNHVYPLMSPGWGSVSPYILLSDGDTWDVGTFTSWAFYHSGYYACFDQDVFEADPGDSVTVSTKGWATNMGTNDFENLGSDKLAVALYDSDWNHIEDLSYTDTYSITFDAPEEEGVYYLMALDHNAKNTEKAAIGPGTARLIVGDAGSSGGTVDITEYYQNYDFISIKDDKGNYLVDITPGAASNESYGYSNIPTHQVIINEGTEEVYVTFPSDKSFDEHIAVYDVENATADYDYGSGSNVTPTTNEDGTITVTIPVADYTDTNTGVILEDSDYNWKYGFDFVTGEITKVQVGTAVSRILLNQYTTTLVYNKDDQKTAELTATVLPAEAAGWEIQWISSDESIATVAPVEGNPTKAVVTAVSAGTATVTASVGDVKVECVVTSQKYNTAPTVVSAPSWKTMNIDTPLELDVSGWFTDAQGDELTYTANLQKATRANFTQSYEYKSVEGIVPEFEGANCTVTIAEPGVYMLNIIANDGMDTKTHGVQLSVSKDVGTLQINDGITLDIYNIAFVDYHPEFREDYVMPNNNGTWDTTIHHLTVSKNSPAAEPGRSVLRLMRFTVEDGYSWGMNGGATGGSNYADHNYHQSGADIGFFAKHGSSATTTAHYLAFHWECTTTHTDKDHNGICDRCWLKFAEATDCVDDNNDGTCDTCGKAVESTPDQPEITYGDTNGDGNVDVNDVSLVLKHINGVELLTGDALAAANVNGDSNVDVMDVSYILQRINNVISSLPVTENAE